MNDSNGEIQETLIILVGLVSLFVLVAIGVMMIIRSGSECRKYRFIKEGEFDLSEQQRDVIEISLGEFEDEYSKKIGRGVGLCILSPIPLITAAMLGADDRFVVLMVSFLLIIVAVAVNLLVRNSIKREGYMQLLKVEDYNPLNRRAVKIEETIGGVYWPIVVAIFLGWSFIKSAWLISWVVFPLAGLIYAGIVNFIKKDRF